MKSGSYALIALTAFALLIISCTKEADKIGLNIQPPGEKLPLFVTDTISVSAYSVIEDSVRSDEMSTSLLGSFFDPVFGKTTASIYTEIRLTTAKFDFGENAAIDSIVLLLAYNSIWGDSTTMQTFRVFEMSENIHVDSSYYSNKITAYESQIGSVQTIPLTDSILVDTVKVAPFLRIPLNDGGVLASKFLADTSDHFTTNDKFRLFFKGLYITADPVDISGKGALITYNLLSEKSNMTVYFHNSEKDSLKYTFYITNAGARYSHYNHYGYQDADADFKQQVVFGDTTLGSGKIYLQPLGGVKTFLRFPTLTTLGSDISVNEARIIFYPNETASPLSRPKNLVIGKITDNKGSTTVLDDQLEGANYFGGYYNDKSLDYQFRLSRYVQNRLLNPEAEDFGLALLIPGASTVPQSVVLNGYAAENRRIKLVFTYTKIR